MRVYLDANATEPLRPVARRAMMDAAGLGNPASPHAEGRAASAMLERAREAVAARFGAATEAVVFTSGATEANAMAVASLGRGRRVLVGATEHPAVRAAAPDATILPVLRDGTLDLDALRAALVHRPGNPPALVCAMAANNETGVMHPLANIAALCRAAGALLHVDAVQAAGRTDWSLGAADSAAISGHKLGGPAGAGALLLRPGLSLMASLAGGGQERGRRGGTPALPAIAGFAAAAEAARPDPHLAALRDRIEAAARTAGAMVVGAGPPRLPNTTCLRLPGRLAERQVMALDLDGIAVSAGAACSAGRVDGSVVLAAMGLQATDAIRVSLPWSATEADADAFIAAYDRYAARTTARAAA